MKCSGCGAGLDRAVSLDGLCPRCLLGFADEDMPVRIAGYRIVRRLGSGGMGEVYLACGEGAVRRLVALKRIKLGIDSRRVLSRFDSERQALAMLNHPGIAQIYGAGTSEDGLPYFVMEFVEGLPITDHCDERRLPLRERLALFVKVCDAVRHAHRKAIIHRDLKPSNVLVADGADGWTPKIIDFGVAKATGEPLTGSALATEAGLPVGTPAYMSPEQALGSAGVDTRTDVYSLGVLLYELLVGVLPYELGGDACTPDRVRRAIGEEQPGKASARISELGEEGRRAARDRGCEVRTLARRIRGDLDRILLKALEKEPARRYDSPSDLADDIRRHLERKPILARPPGLLYRSGRLVRRHRALTAACGLAVLGLVLGALQGAVGLQRARQEARNANQVTQFLIGLFEEVHPTETGGYSMTAQEVLEAGAARVHELDGQPELQVRFLLAIGEAYLELGLYSEARPLLERSAARQRSLFGPRDHRLPSNLTSLGRLASLTGDHAAARTHFEEAVEILTRRFGNLHRETATAVMGVASAHARLGDHARALELYRHAENVLTGTLGHDHPSVLDARVYLAELAFAAGDGARGRELYEDALARRARVRGPDHPEVSRGLTGLAAILMERGEYEEALPLLFRARDIHERTYGAESRLMGSVLHGLGLTLLKIGRFDEARTALERAVEIRERTLGPYHADLGSTLGSLGSVLQRSGRNSEARDLFERGLTIHRRSLGPDHPTVARALCSVAVTHEADGRLEEATGQYRDALEIQERAHGPDHPDVAFVLNHLSRILGRRGRIDEARSLQERALSVRRATLGPGHPAVAESLHGLAILARDAGELDRSESLLREVSALREATLGPSHHDFAAALADLADVLAEAGRCREAHVLDGRARVVRRRVFGADHPEARSHLAERVPGCDAASL